MKLLIFSLNLFYSTFLFGQNLLPDGSFESTTTLNYVDPVSAFPALDHWFPINYYPIDTTYRGTPDLFDSNNLWPPSTTPNFWNAVNGAFEGDFHVGIANHLMYEGYTTPEAIATQLIAPLQEDEFYYIELLVRNKGVAAYLDNEPMLCVPIENKQIQILLNPDSILVTIDENNKESYTDAERILSLRSDRIETSLVGSWHAIGTCFQAEGDEQFFGITTGMGMFDVNPPCVIYDDHWSAFYLYYYDIDAIKLIKLPTSISVEQTICNGRSNKINIETLVDLPLMQNEIEYHWEDGVIDSVNYISEAGTYIIDAVLDCKSIPITLVVDDFKCDPDVFVPNIFSPNGDGINDLFQPYISIGLPIQTYEFSIFNRWGTLVFHSTEIVDSWDGTFKSESFDNGVYIWLLEYTVDDIELGTVNYKKSGDVTIIR